MTFLNPRQIEKRELLKAFQWSFRQKVTRNKWRTPAVQRLLQRYEVQLARTDLPILARDILAERRAFLQGKTR